MLIDNNDLEQFKDNGFFIKKLKIPTLEFQSYKNEVLNIVKKSKIKNYNYKRIYYDYLFSNSWGAVEVPLNRKIANNLIWSFFSRIKIGNAVKEIAGFNQVYCKLIRLFCMNNFNYCGDWHQDCDQPFKRVQASIYFKDEKGFKIIKPNKQNELFKNYANGNKDFFSSKPPLPFKIDKSFFNEIEGREGEICFFDPFYLHQGCSESSRLQFHMRFDGQITQDESFVTDENIDFLYNDFYDFNYQVDKNKLNLPSDIKWNLKSRIVNTVNYFLPILNYRKKMRFKKKYLNHSIVKPNLFSNTFWQ